MAYLLDTCAILFVAERTSHLSRATLELIDAAPPRHVCVSAISVAELACLQERGRIALKHDWRRWWKTLLQRTGWTCLAITEAVMAHAYSLPPPSTVTLRTVS